MEGEKLPEVRLVCLDEESAKEVMRLIEEARKGKNDRSNTAAREGDTIVITYFDKRWPYDIADMAGDLGLAGDAESAEVFACL